ncbi:hypothetical protein SELMODRAFT_403873 [Selaginella moellendorffii]|uniref:Pectinesterase inhibitor domain-containing protein n=1 Tax=Selaginella moellendorffii TaxID=88036 RepID=D8QSU2_SELML|nr:hypothetical protein SELMODRAFT_403873 [Selaginella moellendorffii]
MAFARSVLLMLLVLAMVATLAPAQLAPPPCSLPNLQGIVRVLQSLAAHLLLQHPLGETTPPSVLPLSFNVQREEERSCNAKMQQQRLSLHAFISLQQHAALAIHHGQNGEVIWQALHRESASARMTVLFILEKCKSVQDG